MNGFGAIEVAYMKAKQTHCMPSCTIPRTPAIHWKVSSSLQHPAS